VGRIEYANEAVRDFRAIIDFIAEQDGELRSAAAEARILKSLAALAAMPRMGRKTRSLEPGSRSFSTRPWIIYYDPLPGSDGIHVARIIDGRRDLDRLFRRKP
jgi:plasmid stabilization system protein ParE